MCFYDSNYYNMHTLENITVKQKNDQKVLEYEECILILYRF